MKKSSTPLMKRDWNIVEHKRWYFIVSALVILLGIILTFTIGPKIGIDFKSGFIMEVQYQGNYLTSANQQEKSKEVTRLLKDMVDSDNNNYGIEVSDVRFQGEADATTRTIRLIFQSNKLNDYSEADYKIAQDDIVEQLRQSLVQVDNPYFINVRSGGQTSPSMSSELLYTAIVAIVVACIIMLLYVMFRFELASGVAAILALLHDLAVMFAFMVFFQIEINSTFIAAIVAILGYSINNTLVVFDRVRENNTLLPEKNRLIAKTINLSLKETFGRSVNTTVTTLFAMVMLAILGVSSIQIFAFPIIVGIMVGAYSSYCIAPSIYVLIKTFGDNRKRKKAKTKFAKKQQTTHRD